MSGELQALIDYKTRLRDERMVNLTAEGEDIEEEDKLLVDMISDLIVGELFEVTGETSWVQRDYVNHFDIRKFDSDTVEGIGVQNETPLVIPQREFNPVIWFRHDGDVLGGKKQSLHIPLLEIERL